MIRQISLLVGASLLACAGLAFAGDGEGDAHAEDSHAAHAESGEHGEEHAEHHQPFNWTHGLLWPGTAEEGQAPSLTAKQKDEPVAYLAMWINAAILAFVIFRFAGPAVRSGLKDRKSGIMRGIEEASRMRAEAEQELSQYRDRLATIDAEIARVKRDMAEAADAERRRVLAEAKTRHDRMERDARELVEHELKAMRELLLSETARTAIATAQQVLSEQLNAEDRERLSQKHLTDLKGALQTRGQA